MKLVLSAALLAGAASASAHSVIRGDAARALMQKSVLRRKLEDEDAEDEEDEEEYAWMQNYKVKFVGCVAGEGFQNQENGEYESASVIYRLCPSDGECDEESNFGCSDDEGYGDYVVGINTYTEAYAETLEEDRRGRKLAKNKTSKRRLDDEFELREFAECGKIDIEDDEDENDGDDEQEDVEYFVGPACSEDGKDIILSLFSDEDCTYEPDTTFYELAGQNLPFYDGGIASSYCQSCVERNDDGEAEVSEFCMKLGEASGGCDEYDQSQCENIEGLTADLRAEEKKSSGWKIFWIIVGLLCLGGIGWYIFKKQAQRKAAKGVDTTPIGGGAMS